MLKLSLSDPLIEKAKMFISGQYSARLEQGAFFNVAKGLPRYF